jgi:hypothetical protein
MHNKRVFLLIATAIFLLVALLHLLRLFNGWSIIIAGCAVPMWVSWPGMIVASLLGCWGLMLARKG